GCGVRARRRQPCRDERQWRGRHARRYHRLHPAAAGLTMGEYIVFTLAAPLASFGGVAGNERRGSMDRPGHSMLAGLVSAALGIRRIDEDLLRRLSDACRFAVRADAPGQPL